MASLLDVNKQEDLQSQTPTMPPPPPAGQEGGLLGQVSSVAQQVGQAAAAAATTAATKAVTQPVQAPAPLNPVMDQFDIQHPDFNPWNYIPRFADVVHSFVSHVGTWPALGIAHDLTRSAVPLDMVGQIGDHIRNNPPVAGNPLDPSQISGLANFNPEQRALAIAKGFFGVKNAPWQGIFFDTASGHYLVNENEQSPIQAQNHQLLRGMIDPNVATSLLEKLRSTVPQAIGSVMPEILRGDSVGALLKLNTENLPGLEKLTDEERNLLNSNANPHSSISGDNRPWWAKAGGVIGGELKKELRANVQAATSLVAGAHEAAVGTAQQALGSAYNVSDEQNSLLQRSLGAAGLVSAPFSFYGSATQDVLQDENVPHPIAKTAGAIVNLALMGPFARGGWIVRTIGGAAMAAGTAYGYETSPEQDPVDRAIDAFSGGAQATQVATSVAAAAKDTVRIIGMAQRTLAARNLATVERGKAGTIARLGQHAELATTAKTEADAAVKQATAFKEMADPLSVQPVPKEQSVGIGKGVEEDKLQAQRNVAGEGYSPGKAAWTDESGQIHYRDESPPQYPEPGTAGKIPSTPELAEARAAVERADTPAARAIANRDLQKAETRALNVKPVMAPEEARAKLADQIKTVRSVLGQIKDGLKQGKDVSTLQNLLATTVRDAHEHVYDNTPSLGKSPSHLYAEKQFQQAQKNLKLGNLLDKDTSPESMSEEQATNLDEFQSAQNKLIAASSPSTFLKPIQSLLNKQHASMMEQAALKQAKADVLIEQVRRATLGDLNTPLRESGSMIVHQVSAAGLDPIDTDANRLLSHLSNGESAIKIARDRMVAETKKLLGNDKTVIAQFEDAFNRPETIPLIKNPKLLQAITDWRGFLSDMALEVHDSFKGEIEETYFPELTPIERQELSRTLGLQAPIGGMSQVFKTTTTHMEARVGGEKTPTNIHPADRLGSYTDAMANAIWNQHMRAIFRDSIDEDHNPAFISYDDSPSGAIRPPGNLNMQRSNLAGLEGWVDSRVADRLKNMSNPAYYASHNIVGEFNSLYKKGVMISPRHAWNQFSSAAGVDANIVSLLADGHKVTSDPILMANMNKYMYAQGEKFMADAGERLLDKHPKLEAVFGFLKMTNAYNAFEHTLWISFIRNLQAGQFVRVRDRFMAQGKDEETASYAAGHLINESTGVSDPRLLGAAEKFVQKQGLFAYIWNKKHFTIPAEAIPIVGRRIAQHLDPALSAEQAKMVENAAQQYMLRFAVMSTMFTQGASVALSGHTTLQNEVGHSLDLEWTGTHDAIFGSDGERHYLPSPWTMFANFYKSKEQVFEDYGPVEGTARNLANITMPLPSWAISSLLGAHSGEDLTSAVGGLVQQANVIQRNVLQPFNKEFKVVAAAKSPVDLLEHTLSASSGVWLGLTQTAGPHHAFQQPDKVLQNKNAVDKVLALSGISPIDATDTQRANAQKEIDNQTVAGINWRELASEVGGAPLGTNSAYDLINKAFDAKMNSDLIEEGVTQNQIDAAKKAGKSPLSTLSPTELRNFFDKHPEIQYGLEATSTNPDPVKKENHDKVAAFWHGLEKKTGLDRSEQQNLDAEYEAGTLSAYDWSQQSRDLRKQNAQAYNDLYGALTPDQQKMVNHPPTDTTPLLPAETAWYNYHQIPSGDFTNPDGSFDLKGYRAAQQAFLDALPVDQQQYIHNRQAQADTPLEQRYFSASDKFQQYASQNSQWEQLRKLRDQLPPFQRTMLDGENPGLKGYFTYRENYFKDNPDVAEFYHRTDNLQWTDWAADKTNGLDKQAYAIADWWVTAKGKHPEYNDPWQTQAATDPKLFAQLTKNWDASTYKTYQEAIQAYYENQAAQRAQFHTFLQSIFNKKRSSYSTGPTVLGG